MALSNDEYMAYQVSLAANTATRIPILWGGNGSSWYNNLVVHGEDANVSFVWSGMEIDQTAGTFVGIHYTDNTGSEATLVYGALDKVYSGSLFITNRSGSAKYYSYGLEAISGT